MKFKNIKKKVYKKKLPSNSRSIPDFAKASSGKPAKTKFSWPKFSSARFINLYGGILKLFVIVIFLITATIIGYDFWKIKHD